MVRKSEMFHLQAMDALLAGIKVCGEGDICATPVRIGIGRSEEEGGRTCEQSYQGVEALSKPCLGFSVLLLAPGAGHTAHPMICRRWM